jgi:hypothetical protein
MEAEYMYRIHYDGRYVGTLCAHTMWEAKDKAYFKLLPYMPEVDRKKITAKK